MGMIGTTLNVVPAVYARPGEDHKSPEGVRRLWEAGKDFRVVPEGPYLSRRDVEAILQSGIQEVKCYMGPQQGGVSLWWAVG